MPLRPPAASSPFVPLARLVFAMLVFAMLAVLPARPAHAFDFLEHSFLTDRACWQAQLELGALLDERPEDHALRARYLALALACPDRAPNAYCIDERKAVTSHLHRVGDRPWETSAHPVTLGDFTALGDHLSRLGPVRGLSGARKRGLTENVLRWFALGDTRVGGVVESVGRQGCHDTGNVAWEEVERDIAAVAGEIFALGAPRSIPAPLLSPLARAQLNRGPREPAGLYSFSNPHYLDLVLRNHTHFGVHAFDTWLGYHSASVAIAERSCAQTYALGRGQTRRLARGLPGYAGLDWGALDEAQLAQAGCAVLGEHARLRLLDWARRAEPELTRPVFSFIADLALLGADPDALDPLAAAELRRQLDAVVAALTALVFEGTGLHYLQDGLAGGHIRTIRTRGGLGEARYDHDHDNAEGVSAILRTRAGDFPFVAFGDTYLLGRHDAPPERCDWGVMRRSGPQAASPEHVAACLLRHQRGLLVATSAASLIDWAAGGLMFEPVDPARCAQSRLEATVCRILPLTAASPAGALTPRPMLDRRLEFSGLHQGNLPVPPPPFAYESLVTTVAFDVAGSNAQYGLQLTFLSELDTFANWMTSYRTALFLSPGIGDRSRVLGEFSYNFHWRLSARVMLEGGTATFAGFRGLGEGLSFMAGLGPSVGIVALPEGWVKIPLELSMSFRMPMSFFTSRHGFFGDSFAIDAFWLQFGLGLAFM